MGPAAGMAAEAGTDGAFMAGEILDICGLAEAMPGP